MGHFLLNGDGVSKKKIKEGFNYLDKLALWRGTGDFSLTNISAVCRLLGSPQDKVPAVHVAGTNGKGSTAASVASILASRGERVGMTVSPHLAHLRERIVIDGWPVSDELLAESALEVKAASEKADVTLSFFEGLIACAFVVFAAEKLDWMVLEVGLGGRLDATNIIAKPECALISSIDYDHQHILGDTLYDIAKEKAAIVKRDTIMLVGPVGAEARQGIEEVASGVASEILYWGDDFFSRHLGPHRMAWRESSGDSEKSIHTSFLGAHQHSNVSLAIAAGRKLGFSLEDCSRGVSSVYWPARLEWVEQDGRRLLIDCAHNVGGMKSLLEYLKTEKLSQLKIAIGMLDTKNWPQMLSMLTPLARELHLLEPDSMRAVSTEKLAQQLSSTDIKVVSWGKDYDGFLAALETDSSGLPWLLTGSIYLVGKIWGSLQPTPTPLWKNNNIK